MRDRQPAARLPDQLEQLHLSHSQRLVRVCQAAPLVVVYIVYLLQFHQLGFVGIQHNLFALDVFLRDLEVQHRREARVHAQPPIGLEEERRARQDLVPLRHVPVVAHARTMVCVKLNRGYRNQVALFHGLQGRLVATEDMEQEDIVRHTVLLSGLRQQFHSTPQLGSCPLSAFLAAHQQVPHRTLRALGQPAYGVRGRRSSMDLLCQGAYVAKAPTDALDLVVS
mmetsp:Transcript_68381/g.198209  ORF Transcript_68381/g.198209 Transcript_68381/m.198209 type:complete len:224 (-) Transcript_68381:2039-2710(-)